MATLAAYCCSALNPSNLIVKLMRCSNCPINSVYSFKRSVIAFITICALPRGFLLLHSLASLRSVCSCPACKRSGCE